MNRSVTDPVASSVALAAMPDDTAARQPIAAARSLVITRAEWNAMVCEDPQADPFWPASWLGAIDPLANRRAELGEQNRAPLLVAITDGAKHR